MNLPPVKTDEDWMREAIGQATHALAYDEVPIGCVIVHEPTQRIVARAFNHRRIDADPTAHAEILALRMAGRLLGDWRLEQCALFVTLEPCPMCAGAIVNARVPRLVYGCTDPKAGAVSSLMQICADSRLNHQVVISGGMLAEECAALLSDFFRKQRALGKK